MQEELKMAIYEMSVKSARLGMDAKILLEDLKIDTVDQLKSVITEHTLTEENEVDSLTVKGMVDILLSADQYAQFN